MASGVDMDQFSVPPDCVRPSNLIGSSPVIELLVGTLRSPRPRAVLKEALQGSCVVRRLRLGHDEHACPRGVRTFVWARLLPPEVNHGHCVVRKQRILHAMAHTPTSEYAGRDGRHNAAAQPCTTALQRAATAQLLSVCVSMHCTCWHCPVRVTCLQRASNIFI